MNSKIVGHILIITIINPQIDALNLNSFKENLEKEISQNKKIILDFSNVKLV
jgi:anti-anti-sigma regulatory factor